MEIVTLNHIVVYRLLALDSCILSSISMYKLFVRDRNILYHITVCKQMKQMAETCIIYIITKPFCRSLDATQGQFVLLIWIVSLL